MTRFAAIVILMTLRCEDCRIEYCEGQTWTIRPGAAAFAEGDRGRPALAWCMTCAMRHGWLQPPGI